MDKKNGTKNNSGLSKVSLRIPTIYEIFFFLKRNLDTFFNKLYLSEIKGEEVNFKTYLEKVDAGEFKRKICLGVSDKTQGLFSIDLITNPGCVTIGGQGSGKTTTMKSILLTHYIANCDETFYLIIDASGKGAGDFSNMFHLPNVATAINDIKKLVPSIAMAYNELKRREEAFRKIGGFDNWVVVKENSLISEDDPQRESKIQTPPEVKLPGDLRKYEAQYASYYKRLQDILKEGELVPRDISFIDWLIDIDPLYLGSDFCDKLKKFKAGPSKSHGIELPAEPKKLSFFLILFEEFHVICPHKDIEFLENANTEGTVAYQLKQIARFGRSYGFSLFISTQRATYTEIPNDLKTGVSNALAHRVTNAADASVFNLGHAADIKSTQIGRSAHESGFFQSPFFPQETQDELIKRYYKDFNAFMFGNSPEEYKKVLSGEGSDGMVETSDYSFLILNSKLFDNKKIIRRFLNLFDFKLVDDKLPKGTEISAIFSKDGKRYALFIAPQRGRGMSFGQDKTFEHFKKEVNTVVKVDSVIIISFGDLNSDHENFAKQYNGYAVDREGLLKTGRILDSKEESIRAGIWDELYKQIPFVREEESKQSTDDNNEEFYEKISKSSPRNRNNYIKEEQDFMKSASQIKPSKTTKKVDFDDLYSDFSDIESDSKDDKKPKDTK